MMAKFSQEVDQCVKFVECPNPTPVQVVISPGRGCKGTFGKREVKLLVDFLKIPVQGMLVIGDCKRYTSG